jgi:hypothetical protein
VAIRLGIQRQVSDGVRRTATRSDTPRPRDISRDEGAGGVARSSRPGRGEGPRVPKGSREPLGCANLAPVPSASDQGPPRIYQRPTPRRNWRPLIGTVVAVIVVGVIIYALSSGNGAGSDASNTGNTGPTSTTIGTSPDTASETPAELAAQACSVFESADLFYAHPHNLGEVATALTIERLTMRADAGDDADFGSLAADGQELYVDVASPSGGYLSDGPDIAFSEECNKLLTDGTIS